MMVDMEVRRATSRAVCVVVVCLCCASVGVLANPEGARVVDSEKGVSSVIGNNGQQAGPQSLQSVLYSIEERLRGLDLVYAPRYAPPSPRQWDGEQNARRLDAVDGRLARIEALLELRLDKIVEAVSGNQMKQSLFNEQMTRKIETLYDRLSQRMHHTENRLDLDVAKMQLSIDSGFVRIARTERESEGVEGDVESQLGELQRQFDGFETAQNATAAALATLAGTACKRAELNDAENAVRDFNKQDVELFAASMENVATKVNKMVTDFSQRTQAMEGLVKNAMSLANATRRELQDGLRSLGLRLVHHGTKHNKEKESSFEFGWDALAALMGREFGNLGNQLASNHDKLIAAQDTFRDSCYRLQEQDQQLSGHIANILDKTLDITDNRSQEVSKRLGTLGEIIKSHGIDGTRRLDARDKSIDLLPQRLNALDSVLQVIKEQVTELATLNAVNEDAKENCLDASQVADKVASAIDNRRVSVEETSRLVAEQIISLINTSRTLEKVYSEDEEFLHLEEFGRKSEKDARGNASKRKSVLDIAEEDLGETLEYNVTEDVETKAPSAESLRAKELVGESEFEFDKLQPDGDTEYDDDDEVATEDIVDTSDISSKKDKDIDVEDLEGKSNDTAVDPTIGAGIRESSTNTRVDRNQGGVASMEVDPSRNKNQYVEGDKTNATHVNVDKPIFSDYWHRSKNVNASDLSGDGKVKITPKGHHSDGNVNTDATSGVGTSQERTAGEDLVSANNLHLRLSDRVNINHDEDEYGFGD